MSNKEFKSLVSQTSVAQLSAEVVDEWKNMDEQSFLNHLNGTSGSGRVYPVLYDDTLELNPYLGNNDLPWD